MNWFSKNAVRAAVLIVASGLAEHAYAAIGGAVTIGASADNSTIKMTFGSFSSATSAASASAVWGVAYVKPASDWGTSGAVEVSFQLFNPGATYLDQTTDNERIKSPNPVYFNLKSTAPAGFNSQQYLASAGQTTSSALSSVTISPTGGSPFTLTTSKAFSSAGEYQGAYNGNAGQPGDFNYNAMATGDINAPLHTAGGGDIMNWRIAPTTSGKKIYVSDFYNTSVSGVYAGFHLQGINSSSSFIGAQASDIVYVTPEPGTWAAIVGVASIVGWQVYSRRRNLAAAPALKD